MNTIIDKILFWFGYLVAATIFGTTAAVVGVAIATEEILINGSIDKGEYALDVLDTTKEVLERFLNYTVSHVINPLLQCPITGDSVWRVLDG